MKLLDQEVSFLRKVDESNKKIINGLMDTHLNYAEGNNWAVSRKPTTTKKIIGNDDIFLKNRYAPLSYGNNTTLVEDEISISESNVVPVNSTNSKLSTASGQSAKNKSGIFIDTKPENNKILSHRTYAKTIPGNSTYSHMAKKGKKIMVVGDSMLRWVGGKKLSEEINNGVAFVKA